MSFVLLWQPSDCVALFLINYIYFVLFSENNYNAENFYETKFTYYIFIDFDTPFFSNQSESSHTRHFRSRVVVVEGRVRNYLHQNCDNFTQIDQLII